MKSAQQIVSEPPFRPTPEYLTAVLLGWLIPGAGHWLLGQRTKAVVLASVLLGLFWWGECLAGGYAVIRKEHEWFFLGQIGSGLSTLIANKYEWADVKPAENTPVAMDSKPIDRKIPGGQAGHSMGILLTTITGILNAVLVLQIMDPRSWEARRRRSEAAR